MNASHFSIIAKELNIKETQVQATINLLDNGATIPFVARYRKEVTGSLDEVYITKIRNRILQLRDLDKRREAILKSIEEQGKLTPELKKQIENAKTMAELEDLYLPYKPKRRTRATIAKEKGLEPLADFLWKQNENTLEIEAEKFISEEREVKSIEEALAGARDIIAEKVNEDKEARVKMRDLFWKKGIYQTKVIPGKEEAAQKYKDYFEWTEAIEKMPSHRVLAIRRAEKESFISIEVAPEDEEALEKLEREFLKNNNASSEQVKLAIKDAYKRLLKPSMETEVRLASKKEADEEAVQVFAKNLRDLLLASPLGEKNILAIDPAFRTGCKVVCLNKQGTLLHNEVIFPDKRRTQAATTLQGLVKDFQIEAIAIGNGTASRETESFVKEIGLAKETIVVMVNESGASVYSASEVAREEFPDYDLTVRGAVSIGRRLSDPLAELVKIDPKSIGVGQYQHDVDQSLLKQGLDDVVMSCVNAVGVEVNTASKQLLTYVSGLGPQLAQKIVDYRTEKGAFKKREELKDVPRLGNKAFEQAAGFLRIRDAENPLDRSAVHPESYHIVEKMAQDLHCKVEDLMKDKKLRKQIDLKKYTSETVGLPTLQDILEELAKPGRDPRDKFETVDFAEGINEIEDLKIGMQLNGVITNVTNFGAFVDIGVHVNGLVHISNLSNQYVKNPADVVKVNQKVEVTIIDVDIERKRVGLSMVGMPQEKSSEKTKKSKPPKNFDKSGFKSKNQKKQSNKIEEIEDGDLLGKLQALKDKFGGK